MLHLIIGPMYSKKSDQLITEAIKLQKDEFLAFKPKLDVRTKTIYSRTGKQIDCINIENSSEIYEALKRTENNIKYLFFDEVQFMDSDFSDVIRDLSKKYNIYCSGLDTDFRRVDFPIIVQLKKFADITTIRTSVCSSCGKQARYTKKWIDGKAASLNSNVIEVEDFSSKEILYEAACKECHNKKERVE